jgi:osmotically-inducible protein OsmY
MNHTMRFTFSALALVLVTAFVAVPVGAGQPDAWLTTRIKMALVLSPDVHALPIDVDTFDARVTLHGKVASRAERDAAQAVATRVEGVQGVRNLLQVVPANRSRAVEVADAELQKRVSASLKAEPRLANSRIAVKSVNQGLVLLNGSAMTLPDHLLALETARCVPGVRSVASEIESPDTFGDQELWYDDRTDVTSSLGDTWITAKVKLRFMTDPAIPASDIQVDTRNGNVSLFGTVPSAAAATRAAEIAAGVAGVKHVENDLGIVTPAVEKRVAATDDQLQGAILKRLDRSALPGADIQVEVRASVARLIGTVKRPVDRYDAVLIARSTPGVNSVRDELQLEH